MNILKLGLKTIVCLLALYGAVMLGFLARRIARTQRTPTSEQTVGTTALQPVVIIGSGTAGLVAAKTILEEGVPVMILEGKQSGGPLNAWTPVANWPGLGHTSGNLIVSDLRAEVEAYKNARFIARSVTSVDFTGKTHLLRLDNGEDINAQAVIIASGTHERRLTVPGADEYAKDIYYNQKPSAAEKGKPCVVIGGGIDALRKAINRMAWLNGSAHVTLVVRGKRLAGGEPSQKALESYVKKGKLTLLYNTQVRELVGKNNKLTGVRLSDGSTIQAEYVCVGIGREPNSEIFKQQLELDKEGWIALKNSTQATSRPGVFAAGDITGGGYLEGAIAAGDGMKAGKDLLRYLTHD